MEMRNPTLLDRIEKGARVALWLAIASACLIGLIAYMNEKRAQSKTEASLQEELKNSEAHADELVKTAAAKPKRLTLASMGTQMSGIIYSRSEANLWFTNVSEREGPLCVVAHAQDPDVSVKTATTNAECTMIKPYSSAHLSLQFAGADLATACPKQNCSLTFGEAPEGHDEPIASVK